MKVRLYIKGNFASGEFIELDRKQKHYLANVLRAKDGKEVFVFNPSDGEFKTAFRGDKLEILEQTITPTKERKLTLVFAPVKFGKIDFLVQKATELGVTHLQPIKTRFTQMTRINYERVRSNIIEACEQCGRTTIPEIAEMVEIEKFIADWSASEKIIFCDESGKGKPIFDVLSNLPERTNGFALLIGPEGGFAEDEHTLLRSQKNILPATMGKRLMTAEAAAIASLAAFQTVKGDWR